MDRNGVFAEIRPGLKTIQNPITVDGIEKDTPRNAPPSASTHARYFEVRGTLQKKLHA